MKTTNTQKRFARIPRGPQEPGYPSYPVDPREGLEPNTGRLPPEKPVPYEEQVRNLPFRPTNPPQMFAPQGNDTLNAREAVPSLRNYLEKNPDDVGERLIYADALEEGYEDPRAAHQRWMAQHWDQANDISRRIKLGGPSERGVAFQGDLARFRQWYPNVAQRLFMLRNRYHQLEDNYLDQVPVTWSRGMRFGWDTPQGTITSQQEEFRKRWVDHFRWLYYHELGLLTPEEANQPHIQRLTESIGPSYEEVPHPKRSLEGMREASFNSLQEAREWEHNQRRLEHGWQPQGITAPYTAHLGDVFGEPEEVVDAPPEGEALPNPPPPPQQLRRRGPRRKYNAREVLANRWRRWGLTEEQIAVKFEEERREAENQQREEEEKSRQPQSTYYTVERLDPGVPQEKEGEWYMNHSVYGPVQLIRDVPVERLAGGSVGGKPQTYRNPDIVENYRRVIRGGDLPSGVHKDLVIVGWDSTPEKYTVEDGHHRWDAAVAEGKPSMDVWKRIKPDKLEMARSKYPAIMSVTGGEENPIQQWRNKQRGKSL